MGYRHKQKASVAVPRLNFESVILLIMMFVPGGCVAQDIVQF